MPQNRFLNTRARAARQAGYTPRTCENCRISFRPYRLESRCCSRRCRKGLAYKKANPLTERSCARCNVKFAPKASNKAIYCGISCTMLASRLSAKTKPERIQKARSTARAYSKTPQYRLGQANHKHRRRAAEKQGNITLEQWHAILNRFGHRCAYCYAARKLTMDHVQPLSKDGKHCEENIVPACRPCNSAKSNSIWVPRCP